MAKDTSQTDRAVAGKETGGNLMELVNKIETIDKVLHLQRKLYRWSKGGDQDFERLYNLTYNPNFLSQAWFMLKNNNGSRTAGVDGVKLKMVEDEIGVNVWLTNIQGSLRDRTYKPDLIRRCYIPKPGKDTMRPLGIPTLEDRLVQMVLKLILEPIFEASFRNCSLGFRPNRGPIHAIAQVQRYMRPSMKYDWVIEADIRDCFGNIDHTILLRRMKGKVKDKRILSLTRSFLKAGVLEDGKVTHPISGSPQGGVISPLLANIYLDQMDEIYDEKYHQTTKYERKNNVRDGKPVLRMVRYADDFVILARGDRTIAERSLQELNNIVQNKLRMELAEEKTGIHQLEDGFTFLGYSFRRGPSLRTGRTSTILLPSKESVIRFRRKIKELTSSSTAYMDPDELVTKLNYVMKGWGQYFRYGWVSSLFSKLDYYVNMRYGRWLKKKFRPHARGKRKRGPRTGTWKWIFRRFSNRDLTGRRRWDGGKHFLMLMAKELPSIKLMHLPNDVPTLYNKGPTQTHFQKIGTGFKLVLGMESSVQRHRNW